MNIRNFSSQIIGGLKSKRQLIAFKVLSMMLSLVAYSLCVFKFKTDFVVIHASILIVFGVFKAGAGFEAISTGRSSLDFVLSNWILRIFLTFSWLGLMVVVSDLNLTYSLFLGFLLSLVWLISFDGHIAGNQFLSFINALVPTMLAISVGTAMFFGFSYGFEFPFPGSYLLIISSVVFLLCLMLLGQAMKNTVGETLHCTISPIILFALSSTYMDSKGYEFVFFRVCEGLAQISVFVLSSARGDQSIKDSNLKVIGFGCLVLFGIFAVFSQFNTEIGVILFSSIFVLFYFLLAYIVVRYFSQWSFKFVFLAFVIAILANNYGVQNVLIIFVLAPIYFLIIVKNPSELTK